MGVDSYVIASEKDKDIVREILNQGSQEPTETVSKNDKETN
jgi:hypothetical protein